MRILIIGGTGAIGRALTDILSKSNHNIYITTRQTSIKSFDNINYVYGNALDDVFFKKFISEEWDVIIDLFLYNPQEFSKRYKQLLECCKQYIFISSARVYNNYDDFIIESTPRLIDSSDDRDFIKSHEYSLNKALEENLLLESDHKNWTILRPYITYDAYRLQLGFYEKEAWLQRALNGRSIIIPKEILDCETTLTSSIDVASCISKMIGNIKAMGEIINIASNKHLPWQDVLNIYKESIFEFTGIMPNTILSDINIFVKIDSIKYQILYDRLFNRKFNIEKLKNIIGEHKFIDFNYGVKECLASFIAKPSFKYRIIHHEAFCDELDHHYTPMHKFDKLSFTDTLKYFFYRYIYNSPTVF